MTTRLNRLSERDWRKTARFRSATGAGNATKRKFGTVGDAVIVVLAQAESDLRVMDVHREIEKILDGHVSPSSVKNSLARGCEGQRSPLERVGHGRYRLRLVKVTEASAG